MSISSSIDVRLYSSKKSVYPYDIYISFLKNGWTDKINGMINYLPFDDNGMFNWQSAELSTQNIPLLINAKVKANETLGFMFIKQTDLPPGKQIGVTLLYHVDTEVYSIILSINRKKVSEEITDVNWYLSEIYKIIHHAGYEIESIKFEEHV